MRPASLRPAAALLALSACAALTACGPGAVPVRVLSTEVPQSLAGDGATRSPEENTPTAEARPTVPAPAPGGGTPSAQPAPSTPSTAGAPAVGSHVSASELQVGQCFVMDDPEARSPSLVVEDCDKPHHGEVFHTDAHALDTFTSQPLSEELTQAASDACAGEVFTQYTGTTYEDSSLVAWFYSPTAVAWTLGARHLICALGQEGKTLSSGSAHVGGKVDVPTGSPAAPAVPATPAPGRGGSSTMTDT